MAEVALYYREQRAKKMRECLVAQEPSRKKCGGSNKKKVKKQKENKKSGRKKKKRVGKARGNVYAVTHKNMALVLADNKCEKCGDSKSLHVHHIVYRSKGGTDDISNLMVLCELCHIKEHEGEPVHNLMMSNYRKRIAKEAK